MITFFVEMLIYKPLNHCTGEESLNQYKEVSRMKNVTVRNLNIQVPKRMKIMRTGTDSTVNHTAQANTVNIGRLAIDNELARIKYCV